MAFIPYRLFLKNLYHCCECTYDDIAEKLTDRVDEEIDRLYKKIKESLSKRSSTETTKTLLPKSFFDFLGKMDSWIETYNKANQEGNALPKIPYYCLFTYLDYLGKAEASLTSKIKRFPTVNCSDLNAIEHFMKNYEFFHKVLQAEAVSAKSIERLMNIDAEYSGGHRRKSHLQEKLVDFLLMNVYPAMGIQAKLAPYKTRGWNNIAFSNLSLATSTSTLQISCEDEQKKLECLFKRLFRKGQTEVVIGETLVNIRKKISALYNSDLLIATANNTTPNNGSLQSNVSAELNLPQNRELDIHMYDDIISSHIISFMKWVPMISDTPLECDLMISVDNIIDRIRDKVFEKVKESRSGFRNRKFIDSKTSLFVQERNTELRMALIKAMHDESNIHSQFHEYLGVSIPLCER